MNPIPDHVQRLRQLDELEEARKALSASSAKKRAALNAEIEAVRQLLPTAILIHFDQRRAHNRTAVAVVRRGICGGCHLALSRGSVAALRRGGGSLQVCENCGAFVYLDETEAGGPAAGAKR
jgi:predicted  nucleic acid-binding Zn-ribbon protein